MSRTRKGKKGPGWEPWSNLRERQEAAAESRREDWVDPEADLDDMLNAEADEALDCYLYGPCSKCKTK